MNDPQNLVQSAKNSGFSGRCFFYSCGLLDHTEPCAPDRARDVVAEDNDVVVPAKVLPVFEETAPEGVAETDVADLVRAVAAEAGPPVVGSINWYDTWNSAGRVPSRRFCSTTA